MPTSGLLAPLPQSPATPTGHNAALSPSLYWCVCVGMRNMASAFAGQRSKSSTAQNVNS